MSSASQTEQNVIGLLKYIRQYMDLRFGHAARLNPRFRQVEADLKWHELDSVRAVFRRTKAIAEQRYVVADLLVTFDVDKRRQILATKGQLAIMNEIVNSTADELSKGQSGLAIKDFGGFYSAIDPALKPIIDLIQCWVWWDLPDAADLTLFDGQMERFKMLVRAEMTESLATFYRNEMRSGELSKQGILEYEFNRTEGLVQGFEKRRTEDGNYQQIIARETATADRTEDALIVQLAQHLRAMERLSGAEPLDPSLRDYYSKALQCPPESVKPDKALEFEERYIAKAKQDLAAMIHDDEAAGAPYNFKLRQAADLRRRLESLRAEINPRGQNKEAAMG